MQNIAVFGSAFDPPTLGHQDAIDSIMANEKHFDKVLLVPSYSHAFGKQMTSYEDRLEMLNLFKKDLDNNRIEIADIEPQLQQSEKPVYTYDVLEFLQNTFYPKVELTFVMGPDNLANWHKFHKFEEIERRWSILSVPQRQPVRSTLVRENIAKGININPFVTARVAKYITQQKLYLPR